MNVMNQIMNVILMQNAQISSMVIIVLVNRLFMAAATNVFITITVGAALVINMDPASRKALMDSHVCVWNRCRNGSVMGAFNAYAHLATSQV